MRGFCGQGCQLAWRSDRSHGVVYPAVMVDGARVPWPEWHAALLVCAYCGRDLDAVRRKRQACREKARRRASAPPRGDGSIAALVAQARAGELRGRVIA